MSLTLTSPNLLPSDIQKPRPPRPHQLPRLSRVKSLPNVLLGLQQTRHHPRRAYRVEPLTVNEIHQIPLPMNTRMGYRNVFVTSFDNPLWYPNKSGSDTSRPSTKLRSRGGKSDLHAWQFTQSLTSMPRTQFTTRLETIYERPIRHPLGRPTTSRRY